MRYLFFTGCTIPARLNAYELSARKVADKLDIKLSISQETNCCGYPIESIDRKMAIVLAARILCVAEKQNLQIMTLCNGCFVTLATTNKLLKENATLREEINSILNDVDMEFQGTTEVKHIIRVLYEDVGVNKIASKIERPLKGLKVATHYGCHLLRPSEVIHLDNPEFPTSLDELVKCTGAEIVPYRGKTHCCGGPLLSVNEKLAFQIGKNKLENIAKSGAMAIVTACPFCHVMLDTGQFAIEGEYNIPVLLCTQLLGLALGFGAKSLGLNENKVPVTPVIEQLAI